MPAKYYVSLADSNWLQPMRRGGRWEVDLLCLNFEDSRDRLARSEKPSALRDRPPPNALTSLSLHLHKLRRRKLSLVLFRNITVFHHAVKISQEKRRQTMFICDELISCSRSLITGASQAPY
jgi:hypothetical protein